MRGSLRPRPERQHRAQTEALAQVGRGQRRREPACQGRCVERGDLRGGDGVGAEEVGEQGAEGAVVYAGC